MVLHKTYEVYSNSALANIVNELRDFVKGTQAVMHVYCGGVEQEKCRNIIGLLQAEFPSVAIVGIASNAEIIDGRVTDPTPVLSVLSFEDSTVRSMPFINTDRKAADAIIEASKRKKPVAIEILPTVVSEDTLEFFDRLSDLDKDILVFGGMPFGHSFIDPRYIIAGGFCSETCAAAIFYYGDDLHISVGCTAGWQEIGIEAEITKADYTSIIELNHHPAIDFYKHYVGIGQDNDFGENTSEFPLMVRNPDSNKYMLRHTNSVDEKGCISLSGYVREGMFARISFGDPEAITDMVNTRCEEVYDFNPDAMLIYSCAVRKMFWGPFIDNELMPFNKMAPIAGFCTGGEIDRDMATGDILWHNITMLTIGFREGNGRKRQLKEVPKVNIGVEYGQTSLVKRMVHLVRVTMKELEDVAITDGLTGLYNRKKTEYVIDDEILSASDDKPLSLIMLDIDHFKDVNDTYGHDCGDVVLIMVSDKLKDFAKSNNGYAGRWGGEEFFIVLPRTDEDDAKIIAESLRREIEALDVPKARHVTASLGTITVMGTGSREKEICNEIYSMVDKALYEAKETGRNKVISCKPYNRSV